MKLLKTTLILAIGATLVAATAAQAKTTTFQQVDDTGHTGVYYWSNASNWNNGLPAAGDQAVVPKGAVATVDTSDATCITGYLTLQAKDMSNDGGRVNIATGKKLTLDGNGSAQTSTFADGSRVRLMGASSAIEIKDDNHTFDAASGAEGVIGESNSAEIREASGQTRQLTLNDSDTIMKGAMRIKLNLVNNGMVVADDGTSSGSRDTLEFYSGTFTGSGQFVAHRATGGSPAILKVGAGVTATAPTGPVKVFANSVIDVDEDFSTSGDLDFQGGSIDVAPSKSFTAG